MKVQLISTLCIVVGSVAFPNYADEWNAFKVEHQKVYKNQKEELEREKIFLENKKAIEAHNEQYIRGDVSYKLGVNEFSDLHPDEFKAAMLGIRMLTGKAENHEALIHVNSAKDIPDSIDWRSLNPKAVYPVQNCDMCEASWAYSAIASLAGQLYLRKRVEIPPLSAQNLIDCTYSLGNTGCEGGTVENAFTYIKTTGGLDTEDSYFFNENDQKCSYNATNAISTTVTGYVEIKSGDEAALLDAVSTVGPVAVSVGASDNAFMMYRGGIYDPDPSTCYVTPGNMHHMVLLVGYGSEGGKAFWIIQNNWGSNWGEGGYMRLIRNGKNTCGIATQALYPTVE